MAGSYRHITDDKGRFDGFGTVENLGDAWEAFEELYGMIWFLADGDAAKVDEARQNYKRGIDEMSPGRSKKGEWP